MKRAHLVITTVIFCLLVFIPVLACADPDTAPPVGTPLVREGALAVRLADVLELGAGSDEIAAESRLGELGISPQNGWIADYPVTPDIVGELQQALIAAADASRLPMDRDDALQRFYDVNMELGLSVVPYADDSIRDSSSEQYPAPATVNNYYYNYGPPVVTYYEPPPDYVYLYAWVPFPFWSCGFWFPGYYVLHDFHKTVVVNSRVVYVSNHYRGPGQKRVYIVDPVKRFHHSGTVYGVAPPRHSTVVYKSSPRVTRQVLDINRNFGRNFGRNRVMQPQPSRAGKPVVRPGEKNRPVPPVRPVSAPVYTDKNQRDKKAPVQPRQVENNRTVQAVRSDKVQSQARPLMKSIENKPAPPGRGPAREEQKFGRPPAMNANAGQPSRPHAAVNQSPPSRGSAPARVQPRQKMESGKGQGPARVTRDQKPREQGGSPGAHNDRKGAAPQMRGSERGGRG